MNPKKHALGVFLDNPGQTYFNLGADNAPSTDTSFMGALFGELNLYFIYGGTGDLLCLNQVQSQLVNFSARHQACHGVSLVHGGPSGGPHAHL